MELTVNERWILSNQFKIMEMLSKNKREAEDYERLREAIDYGYEGEYEHISHLVKGDETVSPEECTYVREVFYLFQAIAANADKLPKDRKDEARLPGFDGNNESKLLAFANWLTDGGSRFQEILTHGEIPNSHMPTDHVYPEMLRKWQSMGKPHKMTAAQLNEILA